MTERDVVMMVVLLCTLGLSLLGISALMGLPMPWWSRSRRWRYWHEQALDLEHDRDRFGWADRPSERRKRQEAIEHARNKARRLAAVASESDQ